MFRFCVFTGRVRRGTTSGGGIFLFYVFTGILFSAGPSGTPSFVARRKIGEKGVPKGSKAALWNLAFIRGFGGETCGLFYVCALVQLTRFRPVRGVLRTASTDSIVLHRVRRNRWHSRNNRRDSTLEAGWFLKCNYLPWQRSTQRQGDKRSAEADLIASNAPLRNGTHKARQNGPKHYPGDPTGTAVPLVCLSPLSFFKQRKMGSPKGVGIAGRPVKTQAAEFISAAGQSSHFSQKPSFGQYKSRISRRASLRPHSSSR